MQEIKTRCKQGTLIVTDQFIRVELGPMKQQTLLRSALTGVESVMGAPAVFGMGGGTNLIFHGQGTMLRADLVKPDIAKEILRVLGY